ncbi:F0F1 ATP synthase subunit gamma [Faunimonas sp. B44]|uniref:F0F1 ATP synthase subunit gamma n=1 Tax=Faunimonas sp. B44 TaxID=3461493 RepID=UPI004044458C
MASLKDLRNRIASVKATQKITKAMQMVAAAKLRRAQESAEAARPYAERMGRVLANIAASVAGAEGAPTLMAGTGREDTHLLVVFTAERGLAGAFNSSIARLARDDARRLIAQGKTVKIFLVGKKGYDILRREFASLIVDRMDFRSVKQMSFAQAQSVAVKVLERFDAGEFDVATMYFSQFRSVIQQIPTAQRLIPVEISGTGNGQAAGGAVYEYEPSEEEILADLLPRNLAIQIFRALLENAASEQGARMSAMDSATRNAGDMIEGLSLSYNRQRQAQITKELIEIISGAEAL